MNDADETGRTDEDLAAIAVRDPNGREGKRAASELFGRHHRRVYLWCHRYVREHERAVDLAQDVMLNAYRSLPTFQGRSRFTSWLFVIARNRCLNAIAAPSLWRDDEADPDDQPAPGSDPARQFAEREGEERLRQLVLEHLDESEREALWLRCFERLPVEEIGRMLNVGLASGARGVLQRARRKLRAAIEQQEREP